MVEAPDVEEYDESSVYMSSKNESLIKQEQD